MNNLIKTLSEMVGFPTIVSAVVVCLIMLLVKKIKPKISPKTELIIRLIVSVLVRVVVILITKGDYSSLAESSMCVCGVSLIICAFFTKSENEAHVKELVSAFLPNVSKEQIDEIFSAMPEEKERINREPYAETDGATLTMQNQPKTNDNRPIDS